MSAKKFVAACFRLVAVANLAANCGYVLWGLIYLSREPTAWMPFSSVVAFGTWALLAVLLFIFAIPLAHFVADDIDHS